MKGFLKGLRYISQIFGTSALSSLFPVVSMADKFKFLDSKEQEMQIGFPTDVKHVAHIGWSDDPSQGPPTWVSKIFISFSFFSHSEAPLENFSDECFQVRASRHGRSRSYSRPGSLPILLQRSVISPKIALLH